MADTVRLELLLGQRMPRAKLFSQVLNRAARRLERDAVMITDRRQDMCLDHVDERERERPRHGRRDDRPQDPPAAGGLVVLTDQPHSQRGLGESKIMRRFGQPIVRHIPGVEGRWRSSSDRTGPHGADPTGPLDRKSTFAAGKR